jgi:hypothetical protein
MMLDLDFSGCMGLSTHCTHINKKIIKKTHNCFGKICFNTITLICVVNINQIVFTAFFEILPIMNLSCYLVFLFSQAQSRPCGSNNLGYTLS